MSRPKPIKIGVALLIFGGVFLWNTWIFGFLNHGLAGYTQMSISELNVIGQPFASFFTVTEWLSGLFLLLGGAVLLTAIHLRNVFLLLVLLLTTIIGGLTIFDATHPLDCNRYDNDACALKWARGEVTFEQQEHGIESEMTDYATIALGVILALWALHRWLIKEEPFSYELVIVFILSVAVIAPPLIVSTNDITIEATGQRLWNASTSLAFAYIAYKVWHMKDHSQRKTRKAIA